VIAWTANNDIDGDEWGILARRFDASGSPVTSQFVVNAYTTGMQNSPAVASHGDGTFSILWKDTDEFYPAHFAAIRRIDGTGTPLGSEIGVVRDGDDVSLLAFPDGRAIVVARTHTPAGIQAGNLITRQGLCDPASGCVPDDACSVAAGGIGIAIKLKSVGVDPTAGDEGLTIKGEFDMPVGNTFHDFVNRFMSEAGGLRIVVASGAGDIRSDDTLLVSTGFSRANTKATQIRWKDIAGSVNGYRAFTMRRRPVPDDPNPERVQIKLKAFGATIPVVVGDEPIKVTLELGGIATCGPETFVPATCTFDPGQTSLACN
jgi:hypothetical protein